MTDPVPGADVVTTEVAREIIQRPRFAGPEGRKRDAPPRDHVAVNGYDLRRVELEAAAPLADVAEAYIGAIGAEVPGPFERRLREAIARVRDVPPIMRRPPAR